MQPELDESILKVINGTAMERFHKLSSKESFTSKVGLLFVGKTSHAEIEKMIRSRYIEDNEFVRINIRLERLYYK